MLKYDCRYFTGDKPCKFHKKHKIKCVPKTYNRKSYKHYGLSQNTLDPTSAAVLSYQK